MTTTLAVTLPTFDISFIVEQLSHQFKDWTPERFSQAVTGYRNYLALHKAVPGTHRVPNNDVDEIWHRHILNTKRYMADCEAYFGYYLHHTPYDRQNRPKPGTTGGDCTCGACNGCTGGCE